MKLFDLGMMPWRQTQLIYHALASCQEQSIVICTPEERYACVGYHQDPAQELDIDFCDKHGIGVFRREIGGGTVFLDRNQIFYQLIIARDNAPLDQRIFFKKFLKPVIKTYEALGIDAQLNPVSDLVVNGKRISGSGGGDIGKCKVATGSILLDFDHETMGRILNLPSERFRQKVYVAMRENITTVKKELGYIPDSKTIRSILISNLKGMFDNLTIEQLDPSVMDVIQRLDKRFSSKEWLFKKRKQKDERNIKIIEGLNLIHNTYGDVEMCIEARGEAISDIEIYNDSSQELHSHLKEMLTGKKYDTALVLNTINTISKR